MSVQTIWFADGCIFIRTDDGQVLGQSLSWYPRLAQADDRQRADYRLSPVGIHWAALDEDVSYESFNY